MGFSASWLSLREPADHAARDAALLTAAVKAAGATPVIVDLGCGTGSTARAFAKHLHQTAVWRFLDNDPVLLEYSAKATEDLATTHQIDLRDVDALPLEGASLVTASALLDLCSRDWVKRLVDRLAAQAIPMYAALIYNGVMQWSPANQADDLVTYAFNRHQRGDKGFGSALGPDSAQAVAEVFEAAGYKVVQADSPWYLGPAQAELQRALLTGIAGAAAEAGEEAAEKWLQMRIGRLDVSHCQIGHCDLLALPPGIDPGSS
jgi:SAM-dependent methyltransferase